jgi:hypothetical protein
LAPSTRALSDAIGGGGAPIEQNQADGAGRAVVIRLDDAAADVYFGFETRTVLLRVSNRCCQSNANLSPLSGRSGRGGTGFFMGLISFKRHRFPSHVIRYAVWLYLRFTLSLRDVEEMLAQRGIDVSYETIRCWVIKFGPQIAANHKARRPSPSPRWHLDEMVCKVRGKRMYLWRDR